MKTWIFPLCAVASAWALPAQAQPGAYFRIAVVDEATGRGVPLAELRTTNELRFVTDSAGLVALNEPDLMGRKVYFHVKSHGYEHGADAFGNRGEAFEVRPGGQAQIKLKRLNIAERLYRVTGGGIYRDSALLGLPAPLKQPQMSGLVMGQDTVFATPYRGKLFWLWGDTNRPSYPLGNFATSSATSLLPAQGGLDPSKGVDFTYWVDSEGFSKKMMPLEGTMPVWLSALFAVRDAAGQERLFAKYAQVKSDSAVNEFGLARFNDEKAVFEKVAVSKGALFPDGHPFQATSGGARYVYASATGSSEPFPLVRARATSEAVSDLAQWEGFTCLEKGARYEKAATRLERGADGKLVYGWKAGTPPLSFDQRRELVASGKMEAGESQAQLRSVESGEVIKPHGGSVFWNAHRGRWVMVGSQAGGTSYLGEMWFAEADTPSGPWAYARKILTHEKYTFYNPTQHPFFDQDGGRLIYFEGTYTSTYSGNEDKTPRYDYNQVMYRLALDDARLALPAPVYSLREANGAASYAMRPAVAGAVAGGANGAKARWGDVQSIPFFAVPADAASKRPDGLVPIFGLPRGEGKPALAMSALLPAARTTPLFYALPARAAKDEKPSPDVVPLYEYRSAQGHSFYATGADGLPAGAKRSEEPLCRVWRNPAPVLPGTSGLDTQSQPAP